MPEQEDSVEISSLQNQDHEDSEEKEHPEDHPHHKSSHMKKKASPKKLQEMLEEQEKELEAANQEKNDYKDKYLRTLAEMDNYRKRVKKEKEDYQKYVLQDFLLDLLPVYDNLDRALKAKSSPDRKHAGSDEKSIISGVEMILKQLTDVLKKYNVVEIDALNKPFDPNLHQALSKEEKDDIKEPTVVEVYQKGFLYNGKLLKAPLTKVAIPMSVKSEQESEQSSDENEEE